MRELCQESRTRASGAVSSASQEPADAGPLGGKAILQQSYGTSRRPCSPRATTKAAS
jgi:hypothetical protein